MIFGSRPGALALNAIGALAIAWSLVANHTVHRPVWVLVVGLVAMVTWVLRFAAAALEWPRAALVMAVLSAVSGSLVASATSSMTIVPVIIALLALIGDLRWPLLLGGGVAAVCGAIVAVGAVPFGAGVPEVLAELGGVLMAVFAGLSRRQFRRAEQQERLLRERERALSEEAARVALARDVHDVLAHSLGGLVIQLDAADALLEAGEAAGARDCVVAARSLAAEGLSDARRAVAALREPVASSAPSVSEPEFAASLDDMLAAHRSLGGRVDLATRGAPLPLAAAQATALQRALQEALSNARKHAPGEPVHTALDWQNDRVRLTVSTPLRASAGAPGSLLAATGGGHGLEGMRERFAALPLGGFASAGADGDRFTVTAEARLA